MRRNTVFSLNFPSEPFRPWWPNQPNPGWNILPECGSGWVAWHWGVNVMLRCSNRQEQRQLQWRNEMNDARSVTHLSACTLFLATSSRCSARFISIFHWTLVLFSVWSDRINCLLQGNANYWFENRTHCLSCPGQ